MSESFLIDATVRIPSCTHSGTETMMPDRSPFTLCVGRDPSRSAAEQLSGLGDDVSILPDSFDIDGREFRTRGFGPVAELALIARGVEQNGAATVLVAVSTRLIAEWAKLRALRALCPGVHVTAIGDNRDLSHTDLETNRIRIALQAAACVWGGADTVCVLPHNVHVAGHTDVDAGRHAIGVLRLLRHESHADFPADMLAGSGTIEAATEALHTAARALLYELEMAPDAAARAVILDRVLAADQAWLDGPRHVNDREAVRVGDTHYVGGAS